MRKQCQKRDGKLKKGWKYGAGGRCVAARSRRVAGSGRASGPHGRMDHSDIVAWLTVLRGMHFLKDPKAAASIPAPKTTGPTAHPAIPPEWTGPMTPPTPYSYVAWWNNPYRRRSVTRGYPTK